MDQEAINLPAKMKFVFPGNFYPATDRVKSLLAGCGHYACSDLPLFIAGYNELCRLDLNGRKVLEVCCGVGDLARGLAQAFPQAEVIGMDRYPDAGNAIREASKEPGLSNLLYRCGDALNLIDFPAASLDLVYGQATLHHLAHDTEAVRREFCRVLKPGGRLIFIYEPLGHNPLWSMIRAYRTSRAGMVDESNVFISQLEQIGRSFSNCEVQLFNLFGYPLKSLGTLAGRWLVDPICRLDGAVMRRFPGLAALAANFNAIFTK